MQQQKQIFVCTDGSEKSYEGFLQAIEFINKNDHITIGHVSDPRIQNLPENLKCENIKDRYHMECLSRFYHDKYSLHFQDFEINNYECKRSQLLDLMKIYQSSIGIIGYNGRKGEKLDTTIMGQTILNTVYNSQIPLLVVKKLVKRSHVDPPGFNFLLLLDGSQKSYNSFQFLLTMIDKLQDQIFVLTCSYENKLKEIKKKFKIIQQENPDVVLQFIEFDSDKLTDKYQFIVDYINNNIEYYFDFIVFGNNGTRAELENKHFIGRMAVQILTKVSINSIMIP